MFGFISDIVGSVLGAKSAENAKDATVEQAINDRALQKEFAQNGIRWKVADATAAGIHPLYALGANTVPYTPQGVQIQPDDSLARGIASMGHNIDRAIEAKQTASERVANKLTALQLERGELENDLLRSQIARNTQAGQPPPLPSSGPSRGDGVIDKPLERTASSMGVPSREMGAVSDFSVVRTSRDTYAVVPSLDAKQRIEDQFFPELEWAWRNKVVPFFSRGNMPYLDPRTYPLPNGYTHWRWSGREYVPAR